MQSLEQVTVNLNPPRLEATVDGVLYTWDSTRQAGRKWAAIGTSPSPHLQHVVAYIVFKLMYPHTPNPLSMSVIHQCMLSWLVKENDYTQAEQLRADFLALTPHDVAAIMDKDLPTRDDLLLHSELADPLNAVLKVAVANRMHAMINCTSLLTAMCEAHGEELSPQQLADEYVLTVLTADPSTIDEERFADMAQGVAFCSHSDQRSISSHDSLLPLVYRELHQLEWSGVDVHWNPDDVPAQYHPMFGFYLLFCRNLAEKFEYTNEMLVDTIERTSMMLSASRELTASLGPALFVHSTRLSYVWSAIADNERYSEEGRTIVMEELSRLDPHMPPHQFLRYAVTAQWLAQNEAEEAAFPAAFALVEFCTDMNNEHIDLNEISTLVEYVISGDEQD